MTVFLLTVGALCLHVLFPPDNCEKMYVTKWDNVVSLGKDYYKSAETSLFHG